MIELRYLLRLWRLLLLAVPLLFFLPPAMSQELTEFQIKAAFLYNFITYTEWPVETGSDLNLCVYGDDPFGELLDAVQGRAVGTRELSVHSIDELDRVQDCQVVFIAGSGRDDLQSVLGTTNGRPVLTVADTPGAIHRGVMLNMKMRDGRVTFEANLGAARINGLRISSKLLQLATEVVQ